MKKCPNCGEMVKDEAKFCTYCGAPLDEESQETYDPDHFDWDEETQPLSEGDEDYSFQDMTTSKWDEPSEVENEKKELSPRTLEKIKIVLLVVLIALVASFGGFYYYTTRVVRTNTSTKKETKKTKQHVVAEVGSQSSSSDASTSSSDSSTSDSSSSSSSDSTTKGSDTTSSSDSDLSTDSSTNYPTSTASDGTTYVNEAYDKDAKGEYGDYSETDSTDYSEDDDVLPKSSSQKVTDSDLKNLSSDEIQTAINEIYARNGYKFTKADNFKNKSYYTGEYSDMSDAEADMNSYEKYNIDFMACYRQHHK